MPKYILLFVFQYFAVSGFTQESDAVPLYHDSLRNDPYILEVNHKTDSIYRLIRSKQVRYDTVELSVSYTTRTTDGSFILQNPYSFGAGVGVIKDTTYNLPAIVVSYQGEILCISFGMLPVIDMLPFKADTSSHFSPWDIPVYSSPGLYFDHNTLIYSYHACSNPSVFIGSCGGTLSTYGNYFKDNRYYSTLIGGKTYYCGCDFNYIVPELTVEGWIRQLQILLKEE